jgi:putative Mn2+ efflux pump MntP
VKSSLPGGFSKFAMTESLDFILLNSSSWIALISIFVIAAALGGDAFAVAVGVGAGKQTQGQTFRLSFHFGLFQFLMPLIGWTIGRTAVEWVQEWDHFLASGILSAVALHALYEALNLEQAETGKDPSRGWYLISLSIATSIDALAVGLVFGVLQITPWFPSIIIGLVAGAMTFTGLYLGRTLRNTFGQVIEIGGAIFLLLIAVQFLVIQK